MIQKIKLGVVGLHFGEYWLKRDIDEGAGHEYVTVTAVCDKDRKCAERCAQSRNCGCTDQLSDLLSDADVEAVALITPPTGRAALIRECIAAGKPVLTTKPFETNAEDALAVLREARSAGIPVHMNSPSPVPSDDLAQILSWNEQFRLGKPIAARWENYARYHEENTNSWYDSPELCPLAPVFRIGIYGINDLLRIFGEVDSVQLCQSRIFTGRPTPDNAELLLKFKNGGIASIFASFCIGDGLPYPGRLILHYENGTIERCFVGNGRLERTADFHSVELRLNCLYQGGFHSETRICSPARRSGSYLWKEFYTAVRTGKPLPGEVTPEEVAASVHIIETIRAFQKGAAQ